MDDKIKQLPNVERNKAQAGLDELKRNMPMCLEHAALVAQLRMRSFKAHLEQGFTPEQALMLCTKPFGG